MSETFFPPEVRIIYHDTKLKARQTGVFPCSGERVFTVSLLDGEWPSDGDLVALVNGDHPNNPHHYGGHVQQLTDNMALVRLAAPKMAHP